MELLIGTVRVARQQLYFFTESKSNVLPHRLSLTTEQKRSLASDVCAWLVIGVVYAVVYRECKPKFGILSHSDSACYFDSNPLDL